MYISVYLRKNFQLNRFRKLHHPFIITISRFWETSWLKIIFKNKATKSARRRFWRPKNLLIFGRSEYFSIISVLYISVLNLADTFWTIILVNRDKQPPLLTYVMNNNNHFFRFKRILMFNLLNSLFNCFWCRIFRLRKMSYVKLSYSNSTLVAN